MSADDCTANARACVAGGLGRKIIGLGMHDHRAAFDALRAFPLQSGQVHFDAGNALRIRLEAGQVAGVMLTRAETAMRFAAWVEMPAGARAVGAEQSPFSCR